VKIALVSPGGFDPGGRINVIPALLGLAEELARRHEVHVFAFGGPGPITRHSLVGARVHQLGDPASVDPPRPLRGGRMMARLAWQLAREFSRAASPVPFQLIHAFWANEPGFLAGLLGRVVRVPVVVTIGGGEATWMPEIRYGDAGSMVRRAITSVSLGLAEETTIGTSFARSFLRGGAAERARVIPLGVAPGAFDGSPARPVGPPWRLLHVGSLNAVKDHHTLLVAFADVVARLGDVTLDCVGEDTLAGQVQTRARELGIHSRVRFWGFLANSELADLYRTAHLHVLSSRYESQSVVVLEAAAAALPTVGTAVGLLPTLAPDAASCVSPGDSAGLADAICSLIASEPRRLAMGRAAHVFARAHDVAWTARAFADIYDRVARRHTVLRSALEGHRRDEGS